MNMMVFEFTRNRGEPPVTVFAADLATAEDLFRRWSIVHDPEFVEAPPVVFPFNEQWLDWRPVLRVASRNLSAGIGYWDPGYLGWTSIDPETETALELAPPQGKVNFYRFECEERFEEKVFATSYEEAVTFYCIHHTEAWGSLPPAFTAREADRSSLTGPLAILRDQLEAGITGVAQWNKVDGWRILPPDWEPPIV